MNHGLEKLFGSRGSIRARDLEAAGITSAQLGRLVSAGRLERVARGLYALPGREVSDNQALLTVAAKSEKAFFCLLTALRFHGLTTQAPFEIWIGIGHKDRIPRLDWPPLRVVRYTGTGLFEGIEQHVIDGIPVRLTDVSRTVVDCFKFRNRIGLDVALEALRESLRDRKATPDELWSVAQRFRMANVMRPYLESVQ